MSLIHFRTKFLGTSFIFLSAAFFVSSLGSFPLYLHSEDQIRLGSDLILEEPYASWIRQKRVGLITNQTGVNSRLESTADLLRESPEVKLTTLFAPEHGLLGQEQAGQEVVDTPDVYSLYGEHRAPTPEMLRRVDVLLFDIQDVGVRFYTYISTMAESMKAAAMADIPFVVLDRPNPITGTRCEGPVLSPGYESFVGIAQLPVRYGLTAGELAGLLKSRQRIQVDLRVVPLKGWNRASWYDQTGLEWVTPSPNMPTLTTATVYPGMVLIEGTNLSEGRGTTHPFEWIGAPWLKSDLLARQLNQLKLPGTRFRPQTFTPTFSKYAGEMCAGLQVHVTDRRNFDPFATALHLIEATLRLHPKDFEFRPDAFDRLAGNSWIREMLSDGASVEAIEKKWQLPLSEFRKERRAFLLYE